MNYQLSYLQPKEANYTGRVAETVEFVTNAQLKDKTRWAQFVQQYKSRKDYEDKGWRGEYWGKMMRGACLTYHYTGDEELYEVLKGAVEGLLATQDEHGRIASYPEHTEFLGWDMWCRKYVFTGLQHFLRICKDGELKDRIVKAMCRAADYICDKVGEGKIDIRKTSHFWGGANSCSILEPFMELYKITNEKRYLDFAEYILSTGGCADGNLLEHAAKEDCMPYQYPENKAYETMSFFEGVLAYSEVTGNTEYYSLVKKFVEDVYTSDITIIGCAGCAGEQFNNSSVVQTNFSEWVMQETCVTVTWMRLLLRLHMLTGEAVYAERIERAALNAMWGTLNENENPQFSHELKQWVAPLPFDSYSPLVYAKRGLGIGGFRVYEDGNYYGCCACIGAAGIAITPLYALLRSKEGFTLNAYFAGEIQTETPAGKPVRIKIESGYPKAGKACVEIETADTEPFAIRFRKPDWCKNFQISVAGCQQDGYIVVEKNWQGKTVVEVDLSAEVRTCNLNGKTAFMYGPLVLALDEAKGNAGIDGELLLNGVIGSEEATQGVELFRYKMTAKDGKEFVFTDYASCGKIWYGNEYKTSVWLNVR